MRRLAVVAAITAAVLNAGCIKKDSAATWYVDAAGRVTWSILERDIRSDAAARADRVSEEAEYISGVQARLHGAARGLTRLDASSIKVTILQDKPPFAVLTEGQFSGLDEMGQRLITRYGLSGSSQIVREGSVWTWTLNIGDPKASSGSESDGDELADLLGDRLTVALRDGRFLAATGFTFDDNGRIASLVKDDKLEAGEDGVLRLALTWEVK